MKIKDILCPKCKPLYLEEMRRKGRQGMKNRWKNWNETKKKVKPADRDVVKRLRNQMIDNLKLTSHIIYQFNPKKK